MIPRLRRLRLFFALLVGSVALTGCDFSVYSLPLPGGADVGENPMTVTVEFANVLDLVPQSAVKVNDISVGQVTDIELDERSRTAVVTLEVRDGLGLPADTLAEIRKTSLLGQKFVSLTAPAQNPSSEPLADGDRIPLERTGRNPVVEEVLGALSLILNGGGVAQLKTISQEISKILEGREQSVKSVLGQLDQFTGRLDQNKADIVDAIEELNRLAKNVRDQQGTIQRTLDELPSALDSLNRQRDDLVRMLQALNRLGDVGVRVIKRSKEDTIASLRRLQPVLTKLADSGDDLVDSFNVALTFPFVDEVVGRDPQVARNLHMGDYTNLSVQLNIDLGNLPALPVDCTTLGQIPDDVPLEQIDLEKLCEGASNAVTSCLSELQNQNPDPSACTRLLQGIQDATCDSLGIQLPLCDNEGGSGGGGTQDPEAPEVEVPLDGVRGLLGGDNGGDNRRRDRGESRGGNGGGSGDGSGSGDGGGLGSLLNRPATGDSQGALPAPPDGRGPTMGQLSEAFDAGLVDLMVPGMVIR